MSKAQERDVAPYSLICSFHVHQPVLCPLHWLVHSHLCACHLSGELDEVPSLCVCVCWDVRSWQQPRQAAKTRFSWFFFFFFCYPC